MKKILLVLIAVFALCINISAVDDTHDYLSKAIAGAVGDEPFIVRVHYGEMLLNRVESADYPDNLPSVCAELGININRKSPTDSDFRAAAAALADFDFCGGALNAKRRKAPENALRLYDWYFY